MDTSIFSDDAGSDFEVTARPTTKKALAKASTTSKAKPAAKASTTVKKTSTTKAVTKAVPKKRKVSSDDENSDGEDSVNFNDNSVLSVTPPSNKKQKKATTTKKTSGAPLQELENETAAMPSSNSAGKGNSDKYQKLTQLEHILKRPDTYIGSVERTEQQMWVFNSETTQMEMREVSYVPGLYKIFDEILVNAADNKQRDASMNEIRVTVDREKGEISIRNNGQGIPIEMHKKEKIYIPEMIFGHLLTGSNYDDNEDKVTGGRNGYGAKLCNIFSKEFSLETIDSRSKQKYRQTWRNNMSQMDKAKITSASGADYTKITFFPDFAKFGMSEMDNDFEALVKRRVYDMAGTCKGVKVFLNEERIKISKFKQYMEMYTKAIKTENLIGGDASTTADTQVILTDAPHERWEIGFAVSDGSFQQVSFVNSIATTSGGTHVNYIADQIVNKLAEVVKKKNKGGVTLKNAQIKNHMFLFVNCLVNNPAFTSQTKEQLTTKASQFGSRCEVSEKFLKDIAKTEVITNILDFAQKKADQMLKKSDGNRRSRMNHSKLTDANKAGTKDGHRCTLILTEGDSASALALAGRAVVNPDLFGVFPLRGKLLNVRDASIDQITKNAEIQNIKKFMGLQHKKEYTDTHSLRYGHLMIMTDQDHDGSHIKGLLINFLQCQYPSLLRIPKFLLEFITPIVKVWKGDPLAPRAQKDFFTMPEYEAWKLEPGNKNWEHKYFKGLGTSNTSDAEVYFADLDKHLKEFHTLQEHENQLIDLAFSKKKADERKMWLQNFVPGTFLDMSGSGPITYDDFINKELILFSMADNQRSIPSVLDGFKPGQRKVLYTCFRRNLKKDVKVVELSGSVSGLTAYAYGDTSLQQTIVGLAQDFVGSNNINALMPSGNFGSRLQGGNDAASPRYIYTRLSPFARRIFNAADEPLLTYNTDDGKTIEPETYIPIIPMILVNGADGIGTGWSTTIPNFNPMDIIDNLKIRMKGTGKSDMKPMVPWFKGWRGEPTDLGGGKWKFTGDWSIDEEKMEIDITELPVRMWTQDFKDRLEDMIKAEKGPSALKDYTEYNTPTAVHFILKLNQSDFNKIKGSVEEYFKLSKTMATTNLVAFDGQGRIHKYETTLDILEEFYHIRLDFYNKRKNYQLGEMNRELEKLNNQARFIQMIIDGTLVVYRKKKAAIMGELQKLGFKKIPKVADAKKQGEFEDAIEDAEEVEDEDQMGSTDYDYLLGMAIYSFTQERVEKLRNQIGDKELEIDVLTKKGPKDIWCEDLDALSTEWQTQLQVEAARAKKSRSKNRRASAKLGIAGKSKKRKAGDDDDDDFDVGAARKKVPKVNALTKIAQSQSSMDSWMKSKDPKPAGAYQGLINLDGSPITQPPAVTQGLLKPDYQSKDVKNAYKMIAAAGKKKKDSDADMVDVKDEFEGPIAKPAARARAAASKSKKYTGPSDSEESEDEFHDMDDDDEDEDSFPSKQSSATTSRATSKVPEPVKSKGRAAALKTKKYADTDEDDSEINDKDLGDISMMVKGTGASNGRTLLSTSARPSSALPLKSQPSVSGLRKSSAEIDDTDWGKLAEGSPHKSEKHKDVDMIMDEEDESLLLSSPRKPLVKTSSTLKSDGTKAASKAPTKKTAASKVAPAAAKPLSPAAKAYAKKQATAKASAPAAKKKSSRTIMDDSDEDNLADDLLSDESDAGSPVPKKTAARPARRAVATKKAYVVDMSEEEEEQDDEEAASSFDEDESE